MADLKKSQLELKKVQLKLDWINHEAARYAVENWHYSRVMPNAGVKIGVWEDGEFIGAVLFGVGAGNSTRGESYGLNRSHEIAELVRVALKDGHASPVSRIVSIAIRMLKKQSPKLRMLISFADELGQNHLGTIYQAGNWIYAGVFDGDGGFIIHGKIVHSRTVGSAGWVQSVEWLRKHVDPACRKAKTRKHRYLYPLDDDMRARLEPLRQPYPKRAKEQEPEHLSGLGGATPTGTLQQPKTTALWRERIKR